MFRCSVQRVVKSVFVQKWFGGNPHKPSGTHDKPNCMLLFSFWPSRFVLWTGWTPLLANWNHIFPHITMWSSNFLLAIRSRPPPSASVCPAVSLSTCLYHFPLYQLFSINLPLSQLVSPPYSSVLYQLLCLSRSIRTCRFCSILSIIHLYQLVCLNCCSAWQARHLKRFPYSLWTPGCRGWTLGRCGSAWQARDWESLRRRCGCCAWQVRHRSLGAGTRRLDAGAQRLLRLAGAALGEPPRAFTHWDAAAGC